MEQILERYETTLGVLTKEEALHAELQQVITLLAPCDREKNDEAVDILQGICGEGR